MTFNPNIPQGADPFSQSQGQIQTNFSTSNTIFNLNHVAFDDSTVADRGKHRRSDYLQVAAPGSLANELAVYQKASGGSSNLFFQRDNVATEVQLTGPNPIVAGTGETFLPGGILIKWGTTSGTGDDSKTFAGLGLTAFPNNCFVVQTQILNAGGGPTTVNQFVSMRAVSATGFTFTATNRVAKTSDTVTFYFIAIGN